MKKKSIFITYNIFRILLIITLIILIYQEYIQINQIKNKIQNTLLVIHKKKQELNFISQIAYLYNNPDYLLPYLVRFYELLDKSDYTLYIMEVQK